MATILDLFLNNPDLTGAPSNRETSFQHLKHGLRIKSAVELNNPLIYGTDTTRIATRSTRTLEIMKAGAQGSTADGGLIGKGIGAITSGKLNSIADVRNKIGDTLGIPQPLLPTVVASKLGPGISAQDVIDKGNGGTEFGKFLKSTGGGTPKNVGNQILGKGITLGKDLLRKELFGSNSVVSPNQTFEGFYTDQKTYTQVSNEYRYKEPIKSNSDFAVTTALKFEHVAPIDITTISPIYAVPRAPSGKELNNPSNIYSDQGELGFNSLENRYKISNGQDGINMISPSVDTNTAEAEAMDLIPFWIGLVDGSSGVPTASKKIHFRALLSGLSETVSPEWGSNQFFGNPYKFYTYTGIDRNLTFSLLMYCSNPAELAINWEKVNQLTSYTYPDIQSIGDKGKMVNPPIIIFRLGDIYNGKVGYLSSLSYTFPDNGTWETNGEIGLLPKFIEVSITIQFIEQAGDEKELYKYKKSNAALKALNDDNGSTTFNTKSAINSNGNQVMKPIKAANVKSITPFNLPKQIKSLDGGKLTSPVDSALGKINPVSGQSSMRDLIGGELTDSINSAQSKENLTSKQAEQYVNTLKPLGYKSHNRHLLTLEPGDKVYKDSKDAIVILHPDGSFESR